MQRIQTELHPGKGWISQRAAALAYGLTKTEMKGLVQELKRHAGSCPRKGLDICALDIAVRQTRGEL
jgi:hypothetical protein